MTNAYKNFGLRVHNMNKAICSDCRGEKKQHCTHFHFAKAGIFEYRQRTARELKEDFEEDLVVKVLPSSIFFRNVQLSKTGQ